MNRLVKIPCPLCKNEGDFYPVNNTPIDHNLRKYGDLYSGLGKSEWKVCGNCGFLHQNPRPSLDDLKQFYLDSKYHEAIPEAWQNTENYIEFARWYYQEKVEHALKQIPLHQGIVFDIGFGHGGAIKLFSGHGWQVSGIEADEALFDFAARKLKLGLIQKGILDSKIELGFKVDLVFSNHTFEHIADLHEAMKGMIKILKPGGFVFTVIPTFYKNRSRRSLEWMHSAHYSLFTHRSLNQLFSYHGLEELCHTYRGKGKEIDELWHLAKFTGLHDDPKRFYENWHAIKCYVNIINPFNYAVHYSLHPRRLISRIIEFLQRALTRFFIPTLHPNSKKTQLDEKFDS